MKRATINANSEGEAFKACLEEYGFSPDAVREVDSGEEGVKAFLCFESAADAETWDKQI